MKVGRTETHDPELITVPDRLRGLNDKKVDEIAASFKRVGQISPILLRIVRGGEDVILIAGAHRLAAVLKLGLERIDAVFIDGDENELRLWEIAENLHRSELTPDERDQHVLEWEKVVAGVEREVRETSSRDEVSGKGGRGKKGGNSETARSTGTSEPTVRRAKKLDALPPEIKEAADKAGLSRNAKLRIADAPDKKVALQDEVRKKRAPKAPKAAPAPPKTPPSAPQPEPAEPEDDAPSLFDDDPAVAERRRREVIEQLADDDTADAIEGEVVEPASAEPKPSLAPTAEPVSGAAILAQISNPRITPFELFSLIRPALDAMSEFDMRVFSLMLSTYKTDRPDQTEAAAA